MSTWDYECGFRQWKNETNVVFETELTFLADSRVNQFGIWTAKQFSKQLQLYTQTIRCVYNKVLDSKSFSRSFNQLPITPNCTECVDCFYDATNNYTYTCDG